MKKLLMTIVVVLCSFSLVSFAGEINSLNEDTPPNGGSGDGGHYVPDYVPFDVLDLQAPDGPITMSFVPTTEGKVYADVVEVFFNKRVGTVVVSIYDSAGMLISSAPGSGFGAVSLPAPVVSGDYQLLIEGTPYQAVGYFSVE